MAREFRHGHGGYVTHGCRCRVCREARIAYRARPEVKAKHRERMRAYMGERRRLEKLAKQMEAQHGESPTA